MHNEQLKKITLDSSKPTKYRSMAALLDIDDSGHVVNFNQAVADHASMFGINIASSLPLAREVLEAVHGLELVKAAESKPVFEGGSGAVFHSGGEGSEIKMKGGEILISCHARVGTPEGFRKLYYFK